MNYPAPQPGGWRIFIWFGLFFFLFDIVGFRLLFWALPNEAAWSEHPFYNFEYRVRKAAASASPVDSPRIVFAGSSLALYSVLAPELEAELGRRLSENKNAAGEESQNRTPVDVRVLSHQGMSTMHLAAYADRILAARPDVVVVPVGTVDFRLERPLMQGIDRLNSPDPAVREAALAESLRYTIEKPEFRMLAPGGWFREYSSSMDMNQMSSALLAALIATYRYRLLVWGPIETLVDNRFSRGRSYHEYAGVPVGGGGITHRGWTARVFELPATPALLASGLLFQAPDELFAAAGGETPAPSIKITRLRAASARGADDFIESDESWTRPLRPGWQTVAFRRPDVGSPPDPQVVTAASGDRLRFELSHVSVSAASFDVRGVRLSRNAGRSLKELRDLKREPRREDDLYRDYSDAEYRESFERRILRFDRAGSEYLEALKQARHYWAGRPFDAELPGFAAFDRFRKRITDAGVPLLVVNNPENPISLKWYGDTSWYEGFVRFLDSGPPEGEGLYSFYDASRLLEMQMFYDYHHLSYHGAERYSRVLAAKLEERLTDRAAADR